MLQQWIQKAWALIEAYLAPLARSLRRRAEPYLAQGRARYEKLEPRERVLAQVAGGLIGLLLAYNLVYRPIAAIPETLEARVATRQRDVVEVQKLTSRYLQLKQDLAAAESATVPGRNFSLFSVIEEALTNRIGRDKIASITPAADRKVADGLVQYSVQLKLNNVSLGQLVDAMYGVRTLTVPVAISNLRIERRVQDTHTYDVDMTCVALGKNG